MMHRVIDFHSHILPDIDDGSASVEESVAMLRMEAEQGITHVIATPHFYAQYDTPEKFLRRRDRAEAALRAAMDAQEGLPRLDVGAEVHFFRGMSDSDFLPQLTIREKSCILIEMPPAPWTDAMYRELEAVWVKRGITPIVAHIDRYVTPLNDHGIPRRLAQLPVLVQANAEFFQRKLTSGMALRMLKAGHIHLLGSDCHNTTDRKPDLGPAVERIRKKLGSDKLNDILGFQQEVLGLK